VRLNLSVYGDEQISRELLRFSAYVGHPRPAFEKIRDDLEEQLAEQFATEGSRGGEHWEPDKESTLAAKAAAGLRPEVLQATGKLLDSFTANTHGEGIRTITDDAFVFGSKVAYGAAHQKGTKTGLPARPILSLKETDRRSYVRTLQKYVTTGRV
jgi:phage gpG-like protein